MSKVVLVTGASSGLGLATAKAIAAAGYTVWGGARSFKERSEADGVKRLPLDVTDEDSIRAFVDTVIAAEGHIDAVVHCAGFLILGSAEETAAEEYARVLDTDFIGMCRVNSAVLPYLRKQRSGRILMFSSINGLLGIPFQVAYTAAKHAVEGYAECLQLEVKDFGIDVCLIEPGDHRSGSDSYRKHAAAMGENSPYAADFARGTGVIHHDETNGGHPEVLGRKVAALLGRKHIPFRRCIASPDQKLAVWLHRLLPWRLNGMILRLYYLKRL